MSSTVNSVDKSVDPGVAFEWNGILSKATKNAHAFTLCLAMQQSALAEPIKIAGTEDAPLSLETQLAKINFYRRPPLCSEGVAWQSFDVISQAINAEHFADARLHLAMHPSPLAQVNNSKKLADDVVNNCSLGTQKRLAKAYTSAIAEDNTLFDKVIENANQVNAA